MPGFEFFGEEERKEVNDVLNTGILMRYGFDAARKDIWKSRELEQAICAKFQCGFAQLTSSGTSALTTALAALGIGAGDDEHDYDERFLGLVSVRTALASSLNTPAVRALGLVGGDAFAAQLARLGFAGIDRPADYYGPALALGSADVSLWEMVGAYRALADAGQWTPLHLRPRRPAGRGAPGARAGDRLPGGGRARRSREPQRHVRAGRDALATRGFWTAVKTGTSTDMRDNWCVGFSDRFTMGVWVGNFAGAAMHDVSGVSGAAPVWLEVMERLHAGVPSDAPAPPPGVVAVPVAFPGDVEPPRREWMLAGSDATGSRPALAATRPRVRAPVSGTRIALDPDVPPERQRLLLEAEHVTGSPRCAGVDSIDLGAADARRLWEPVPGRHLLEEPVSAAGEQQDRVEFEVRGRTGH